MSTSALLEVLEVYFEAFAEHDPIRRGELLAQCLTPDCAIWGHSHVYAGYASISEKIAGFHTNFPDCRLVLASGLMTFDNIARSANAIVRRDGSVVARGETVSEIAPDGRLCRIVPLWETNLPPLPESWPAHLAVQLLPKVSRAQAMIDALVARFFSAFDNRDGAKPRLADLVDCFTDKATIVRRSDAGAETYTVEEFALPRIKLLTQGTLLNFHEKEISSTTQIFHGIATRTSLYGKSGLLDGNDYSGSGTKCFQLVDLGSGWRISSLAWVDDDSPS